MQVSRFFYVHIVQSNIDVGMLKKFGEGCWALGFIEGGIQQIMENDTYDVKWVQMPKDRWYADPFILDVTDTEILV